MIGGLAGWVYNGCSTLGSSNELCVLGILGTTRNSASPLLLCSLTDSLFLELWAYFFFFFFAIFVLKDKLPPRQLEDISFLEQ